MSPLLIKWQVNFMEDKRNGELQQYLQIGKIVNTHGIKGEIKVIPLTDDPDRFKKLKWAYIEKGKDKEKREIEAVKFLKSMLIIKLKGIDNMSDAEMLRDCYILVDRENAVTLPKNTYFICDIIGCEVYEENGNKLGELKDVLRTGSNDVYVVENANNTEILIPALKTVVKDISIENRKIIVELPEGLI